MMDPVATPERAKSQGEGYSSVSFVRGWYFNDGVPTPKAGGLSAPRFCSTRVQVPPLSVIGQWLRTQISVFSHARAHTHVSTRTGLSPGRHLNFKDSLHIYSIAQT